MPTKLQIEHVQRELNAFTTKYLRGVAPLIVDGDKGHATNVRIRTAKYYLGYGAKRDSAMTEVFRDRLRNPRTRKFFKRGMIGTAMKRRAQQRARAIEQRFRATVSPGVTTFDGVPCAIWLARKLQAVRDLGRWKGQLVSGWRSPAYSESLCYRMCGAPSCSGTCAGRASNHSGSVYPAGAADVSDYFTFAEEARRLNLGIWNDLPRDKVHFSVNGH